MFSHLNEQPEKTTGFRIHRRLILFLALVALISVYFAFLHSRDRKSNATQTKPASLKPVAVRVQELKTGSIRVELKGQGFIAPWKKTTVYSPKSAKVVRFSPNLGEGEVLLQDEVAIFLDREEADLDLSRILEDLAQVRLNEEKQKLGNEKDLQLRDLQKESLEFIDSEIARHRELARIDTSAAEKLGDLRMRMLQAREEILKLDRSISLHDKLMQELFSSENSLQLKAVKLKREISLSEIRAPMAGRVQNLKADLGSVVKPGDALFEISDDSRLEAVVSFSSEEVEKWMEIGAEASGIFSLKGEEKMELEWINGEIAESVSCQRIGKSPTPGLLELIAPLSPTTAFKPAMRVSAKCQGKLVKDVFVVSARMLALGKKIHIAKPDGKGGYCLEIRQPAWLRVSDDYAFAREGIQAGELAVLDPLQRIPAGTPLKVTVEPKSPPGLTLQ